MLGTGNFLAEGRYWNSFLVEHEGGTVLFETSPSVLPNLRRAGKKAGELDAVVISHFHPDHTFGWPFLLLELLGSGRAAPLFVVGPTGVEGFLEEMMRLGTVSDIWREAQDDLDLRFVEVEATEEPSPVEVPFRLRAARVEHVPELECYGYLLETQAGRLGYSGDTKPCPGLDALAGGSDLLVVECNGLHPAKSHMDVDSVRALAEGHPDLRLVATHVGGAVAPAHLGRVELPGDFQTIVL